MYFLKDGCTLFIASAKHFCAKTSQKTYTYLYTLFTDFSRSNVHDFYVDNILTCERQGVNHTEAFVRKGVDTQLHTYNTTDENKQINDKQKIPSDKRLNIKVK